VKKNKTRFSYAQRSREFELVKELNMLFDIVHANVSNMVKIKEDLDFLIDQREDRKMFMNMIDKELAKK
jgi:hypothetical protein